MMLEKGLLFTCLVCLLMTCHAAEKTVQGGGISTKVRGQSGKITIDARGSSMTFQVDSVIEVDSNGEGVSNTGARGHQFTTLANQDFTFSTPDNSSYFQGIKVVNINMTADLAKGVNAKLEIMLYIFLEDGNVTFGNESFKVYNGSLKFNIQLSDWTFCPTIENDCKKGQTVQQGEYIDLTLEVKSKGAPKQCSSNKDCEGTDEDCPKCYSLGGGSLVLLNKDIQIDGNFVDMPGDFPKFEGNSGKNFFIFRIPKFNETAHIDPTVSQDDESQAEETTTKPPATDNTTKPPATDTSPTLQFNFFVLLTIAVTALFSM